MPAELSPWLEWLQGQPLLFTTLCVILLLSQRVDGVFLYSAWAFFGLRVVHSLIHCTVNIVNLRFAAYVLSSLESCGSWWPGWRGLFFSHPFRARSGRGNRG